MKKFLTLTILALTLASPVRASGDAVDPATWCASVTQTSDGFVNLRTQPNAHATVVLQLYPGSILTVKDRSSFGWYFITRGPTVPLANGETEVYRGWVSHELIEPTDVQCERELISPHVPHGGE